MSSIFIEGSTVHIISFFLCLIIFIAQIICYKYAWKPRIDQMSRGSYGSVGKIRTYITFILIIATLLTNILTVLMQLSLLYAWPNCSICTNGYIVNRLLFVTIRCLNRLFFIQRAKLSQEIKPILADKWFDRVLPLTVLMLYGIFITSIVAINIFSDDYNEHECLSTSEHDYNEHQECVNHSLGAKGVFDLIYLGTSAVAMITNVIIAFLFLKPIFMIPSIPNDTFSNSQQTRKQYKTILTYNICLSMINLLSSQFMVSVWGLYPELFWFMGPIDNVINASTTYLMIGRNRQWNKKIGYYCIEFFCCNICVFHSNQQRLSKYGNKRSMITVTKSSGIRKSQFETNMQEMVHGDMYKIRNVAASVTPELQPAKQRLSTFVSEVELRWKSDEDLYRDRHSTKMVHQYTASDNANINVASLNAYVMKMKSVQTLTLEDQPSEQTHEIVTSYTQTQTGVIGDEEEDDDYNHSPRETAVSVVDTAKNTGNDKKETKQVRFKDVEDGNDNDAEQNEEQNDAGSYLHGDPVITKLLTMDDNEMNIEHHRSIDDVYGN